MGTPAKFVFSNISPMPNMVVARVREKVKVTRAIRISAGGMWVLSHILSVLMQIALAI